MGVNAEYKALQNKKYQVLVVAENKKKCGATY